MKPDIALLGIALVLLFGFWGFLYKMGIERVGLLKALMVATAVYVLADLVVIAYLMRMGIPLTVGSGSAPIIVGTLCAVGASLVFMYALRFHPASIVIPLAALYPAVTAVLSIVILKEQLRAVNAAGIVLAVIAGYLLSR